MKIFKRFQLFRLLQRQESKLIMINNKMRYRTKQIAQFVNMIVLLMKIIWFYKIISQESLLKLKAVKKQVIHHHHPKLLQTNKRNLNKHLNSNKKKSL